MFGILRIIIGVAIGLLLFTFLYKYKHKKTKLMISGVIVFVVALITITAFIPFENVVYSFKSAEAVYRYYYYGETSVDLVIEGKDSDFVIGTKNNTSTLLIVPKTTNGWKIGIGLNTKRLVEKHLNGITVCVYQYKDTSDYFITILDTNGGESTITDEYNTKFLSLERSNNSLGKTFVTYYAHIPVFDSQYCVSVNGNMIRLNEDFSLDTESFDSFYITEESTENIISVKVPIVETQNKELVNDLIKKSVYAELNRWCLPQECDLSESCYPITDIENKISPSNYTSNYMQLNSCITLNDEKLLSIVFEGFFNNKHAAHPNNIFFTVNIDTSTVKRITLFDIYNIDNDLYSTFLSYAHDSKLSLDVFDENLFLEGLQKETDLEFYSDFYSYFTPTHIGISYPVPFAMGNHLEIEIPYNEVSANKS